MENIDQKIDVVRDECHIIIDPTGRNMVIIDINTMVEVLDIIQVLIVINSVEIN